jgi:hypothetical protein
MNQILTPASKLGSTYVTRTKMAVYWKQLTYVRHSVTEAVNFDTIFQHIHLDSLASFVTQHDRRTPAYRTV